MLGYLALQGARWFGLKFDLVWGWGAVWAWDYCGVLFVHPAICNSAANRRELKQEE